MKRQVRKGFFIRPEASVLSWGFRCAYGLYLSPSPWPSPARGEGTYFSSASQMFSQVASTSYPVSSVPDPWVPSPARGEGMYFSSASQMSSQVASTSYPVSSVPDPWIPSPARGEGMYFSSASQMFSQVASTSYPVSSVLDPWIPSPLAGEGQGEGAARSVIGNPRARRIHPLRIHIARSRSRQSRHRLLRCRRDFLCALCVIANDSEAISICQ